MLTGSTNFSEGGIYGHSNVVHICEDERIAGEYLWLWNALRRNEAKKVVAIVTACGPFLRAFSFSQGSRIADTWSHSSNAMR